MMARIPLLVLLTWVFTASVAADDLLDELEALDKGDDDASISIVEPPSMEPRIWPVRETDSPPLRVSIVKGLWNKLYELPEALARNGGAIVRESWHYNSSGSGWLSPHHEMKGGLRWFTPVTQDYCDVLIMANVPARAFGKQQEAIVEFVREGGAMLVLGGAGAFGNQWTESPLDELSPVDILPGQIRMGGIVQWDDAVAEPASKAPPAVRALSWNDQPRVVWGHRGEPREGAAVWVKAGDRPLLVVREFGKGRVAVWLGSVMGEVGSGETAAWKWDDWPALMAHTVGWLSEAGDGVAHGRPAAEPAGDLPELRRATAKRRGEGEYDLSNWPDLIQKHHRAFQFALMEQLLAGDVSVATEIVNDVMMENQYVLARGRLEKNKPEGFLERARQGVAEGMDFQAVLRHQINFAPPATHVALAEAIVEIDDPRVAALAMAIFAGREMSAEVRDILGRSPHAAVRALARSKTKSPLE